MSTQSISYNQSMKQKVVIAVSATVASLQLCKHVMSLYSKNIGTTEVIALYIQTPVLLQQHEVRALHEIETYIHNNGGVFHTVSRADVPNGIIEFADSIQANTIVIGDWGNSTTFSKSISQKLLRQIQHQEVLVVPLHVHDTSIRYSTTALLGLWEQFTTYIQQSLRTRSSGLTGIFVPVFVSVSLLLGYAVHTAIGYHAVGLCMLFISFSLSLLLRGWKVFLNVVLSAVAWNYFFIPPVHTFSIGLPDDQLLFGTYIALGIGLSFITSRIRNRELIVLQRENRLQVDLEFTNQLSACTDIDAVVTATIHTIAREFQGKVCMYLRSNANDETLPTRPHKHSQYIPVDSDYSVAVWSYKHHQSAGNTTHILKQAPSLFVPLIESTDSCIGVIGLLVDKVLFTPEEHQHLLRLCKIATYRIQRITIQEVAQQQELQQESQKLYSTIFNSISHEFQTPLSVITSAVETIQVPPNDTFSERLLHEVQFATSRLKGLIGNLLDMSRIESGFISPHKQVVNVVDAVNQIVLSLKKEVPKHNLQVQSSSDVILAELDSGLFEQACINVIRNAIKYTPQNTTITIAITQETSTVFITCTDEGDGVDEAEIPKLFKKFYRSEKTKQKGIGLGLAIVKTFVEAMGGTVSVQNVQPNGLQICFQFELYAH